MLADSDSRLAVRGWVCASYNVLPTDPNFLQLDDDQLMWLQQSKRNFLRELFDGLGTMLGTKMDASRLYGSSSSTSKSKQLVNEADVPLAFLLGTQAYDLYKSILKKPSKDNEFGQFSGKDLQELFQLSLKKQAEAVIEELKDLQLQEGQTSQ